MFAKLDDPSAQRWTDHFVLETMCMKNANPLYYSKSSMLAPPSALAQYLKQSAALLSALETLAMLSDLLSVLLCVTSLALVASQSPQPGRVNFTFPNHHYPCKFLSGAGQCPGGPSLNIQCDPKRPWPQCPPQSYCYATSSVDVGPYYCCPIWSTYGASYRPSAPFYDYVPPMPQDWPANIRATANWPTSVISRIAMSKLKIPYKNEEEDEGLSYELSNKQFQR
ncbi:unnamed protein product [Strongylus vulgaris]|uniref:Uncharacterized protein n=1 Tax=Strongylus vulgaris TaxID=40348 RepID=A0A3P7JPF1_STRVU|nr:unnamed protein product [Strongylus vulgaris]